MTQHNKSNAGSDLAVEAHRLVLCEERLPTASGEYQVLNNSGCNGGYGLVHFDTEEGWDIPDMIKSFYKIKGWFEPENSPVLASEERGS